MTFEVDSDAEVNSDEITSNKIFKTWAFYKEFWL